MSEKEIQELCQSIDNIFAKETSKLDFQVLCHYGFSAIARGKGEELYRKVQNSVRKFVLLSYEDLNKESDSVFLQNILRKWNELCSILTLIRDLLMYLDRNFVPKKKLTPIFRMGIEIFGKELFLTNKIGLERTLRLVFERIDRIRKGEFVENQSEIGDVCKMMLEISKKDLYEKIFQEKLLTRSREFFRRSGEEYFRNNSVVQFIDLVLKKLKQENEFCERNFHKGTVKKMNKLGKEEMISKYKELILQRGSGCKSMLEGWKLGDLRKAYKFLKIVEGCEGFVHLVHEFCKEEGEKITKDEVKNKKPVIMVEDLIALWRKYEDLLNKSFSTISKEGNIVIKNEGFRNGVRNSFKIVLNDDEKIHEYLSLFVDAKLRKQEELDFDNLFNDLISLFRNLRERDIFEKYYKIHLGKRLLGKKSQSLDAERSFISKLKSEFGNQFTSKMEGMFSDISKNETMSEEFKRHCRKIDFKKKHGFELSVLVLTSGHWPIPSHQQVVIEIPKQLKDGLEDFSTFYLSKTKGRKLVWKWDIPGTATVRTNGFKRKYDLVCSNYQMIVLDLFNTNKTMTFKGIQESTKIPGSELERALKVMCSKTKNRGRILVRDRTPLTEEGRINPETKFQANDKFQSKSLKVMIQKTKLKQTEEEKNRTKKEISEERKWEIDACVVRVMKTRKKFPHSNLIMEVVNQLKVRFVPSTVAIKKRIESLIERDFLERSSKNRKIIEYLA